MSTSNQTANNFIEAIQKMVDSSVQKAKYDKTITATIVKCEDEDTAKYRVRYKENYFSAYSQDTNVTYKNGASVFVQIPESDFSKTKLILGLAKDRDKKDTGNLVDDIEKHYFELPDVVHLSSYNCDELLINSSIAEITLFQENFPNAGSPYENKKYMNFIDEKNNIVSLQNFISCYNTLDEIFERIDLKLNLSLQTSLPKNVNGFYGIKIYFYDKDGKVNTLIAQSQDFLGTPNSYILTHLEKIYWQYEEGDRLFSNITGIKVTLFIDNILFDENSYIKIKNFDLRFASYSQNIDTNITEIKLYTNTTSFIENKTEYLPITAYYRKSGRLISETKFKWFLCSSSITTQGTTRRPWYDNSKIQRTGNTQILSIDECDPLTGEVNVFVTLEVNGVTLTSNILHFNSFKENGEKRTFATLMYKQGSAAPLITEMKVCPTSFTIDSEGLKNSSFVYGVEYKNALLSNNMLMPVDFPIGTYQKHDNEKIKLEWFLDGTSSSGQVYEINDSIVGLDLINVVSGAVLRCQIKGSWTEEGIEYTDILGNLTMGFLVDIKENPLSLNLVVKPSRLSIKYNSEGKWNNSWNGFSDIESLETDYNRQERTIQLTAQYYQEGVAAPVYAYYWYYRGNNFEIIGNTEKVTEMDIESPLYQGYYRLKDIKSNNENSSITIQFKENLSVLQEDLIVIAVRSEDTILSDDKQIVQIDYRREYQPDSSSLEQGQLLPQKSSQGFDIVPEIETLYYIKNNNTYPLYRNAFNSDSLPSSLIDGEKWFEADNYSLSLLSNENAEDIFIISDGNIFSRISNIAILKNIIQYGNDNGKYSISSIVNGIKRENQKVVAYFTQGIGLFIVEDSSVIQPIWGESVTALYLTEQGTINFSNQKDNKISFLFKKPLNKKVTYHWRIHQSLVYKQDNSIDTSLQLIEIKNSRQKITQDTDVGNITLAFNKKINAQAYDLSQLGISCYITDDTSGGKIIAYCYLPINSYVAIDNFNGNPIYSETGGVGNYLIDITDEDGNVTGYMFTQQLAAGRYQTVDRDGHPRGWSGVIAGVIGDISGIYSQKGKEFYGLRGYHLGKVSYELGTDDGHVTLGEADGGQIKIIPGNDCVIQSGDYQESSRVQEGKGLKINFNKDPSIQYGNGNFEVDKYGHLYAKGVEVDGKLSSSFEQYADDDNPFTSQNDVKSTFSVGDNGFSLHSEKIVSIGAPPKTDMAVEDESGQGSGYHIVAAKGNVTYVDSTINQNGFTFGKYAGTLEEDTLKREGLIDGIIYSFTNGLYVSGTIRAKKGVIGGWTISDDAITSPSGGLILKSDGQIIGYSGGKDGSETEYEKEDLTFGDYLSIKRDTISWAKPSSAQSGKHIEQQWKETQPGQWDLVNVLVPDPVQYTQTSNITSSNGTVSIAAPGGATMGGASCISTSNTKVTLAANGSTSIAAATEKTNQLTEEETILGRSVLQFFKTVSTGILKSVICANKDNETIYFKGSLKQYNRNQKLTPVICSYEEATQWADDNKDNLEHIVTMWNTHLKAEEVPYTVITKEEEDKVCSVLGRAPDSVVFQKPTQNADNPLWKDREIVETYVANYDGSGGPALQLKYLLTINDEDEVVSLKYPNGVTTHFTFYEEE